MTRLNDAQARDLADSLRAVGLGQLAAYGYAALQLVFQSVGQKIGQLAATAEAGPVCRYGMCAMWTRTATVLIAIVLIASCATSQEIYTASGERGHSINCSGQALSWNMCYEKAGELCGSQGYDVLDKSSDKGATVSANQFGVYGGSVITRTLVVQCK